MSVTKIFNGIECEEVSKETIQAEIRAIPNMECFYSEKFKFLIIMRFEVEKCTYDVYAVLYQNEDTGLFWQNKKSKQLFDEMKVLEEMKLAAKAKNIDKSKMI